MALLAGAWLVLCLAGIFAVWRYEARASASGHPLERWPSGTAIERKPGWSTVVMFLHPRCPCSRASLSELNQVMHKAPGTTAALVFVVPAGEPAGWERGDNWDRAHEIPGAVVALDRGGVEAARFRVETSGHTLMYGAEGSLRFSGGLTAARGHEGDNVSRRQLQGLLAATSRDRDGALIARQVYGCGLGVEGEETR